MSVKNRTAPRCWTRLTASRWILILTLGMAPARTDADLAYFKNGGEVQAPVSVEGQRVFLQFQTGKVAFRRDDFRLLVPGFSPETEWTRRIGEARAEGFAARYKAVWWALENGLISEAADEIRALHGMDPGHAPTARMAATLERLKRPCSDPDVTAFRQALGISTSLATSPHVMLLHQHPEAEANERVAMLERVITGFYLTFAAQGLELNVPQRRLIFAWFADQKDYLEFLHSQGADAFASTRGYFHPTWNAVVAYDARSLDRHLLARKNISDRRNELQSLRATVDRMPARARLRVVLTGEPARTLGRNESLSLIERLDSDVRRQELLLDLDWRATDDGTAAHEAIHLLAANSGFLPRHDAFPVWLQEGLAAQFEVVRGGRWAGISRAHDLRLPDWRRLQAPPRLEPLVRDTGFGRGYHRDLYAQAWALVFFLRNQHSQQFLTFLDLLRGPDQTPDRPRSERALQAFQRAFGPDLDSLEGEWHRFMSTVQTPLERHAPPPDSGPSPRRSTSNTHSGN